MISFKLCCILLMRKLGLREDKTYSQDQIVNNGLEPRPPTSTSGTPSTESELLPRLGGASQAGEQASVGACVARRAAGPVPAEAQQPTARWESFPAKWSRLPACSLPNLIPFHNKWSPWRARHAEVGEMGSGDYYGILTFVFSFRACATAA